MIDLKTILKQVPNCLSNRALFKSTLLDKYPQEKRMVNILTIIFECGIANKIRTKQYIDSNEMQALITQIENEYGISGQYSQEALLIWASAFDITASAIKAPSGQPSSTMRKEVVEPQPVTYVQGDVDDYEVVQRSDGYYITHFNGFEEETMTIPSLIGGNKIKGIDKEAFRGCVVVKELRISEGIEIINDSAFKECKTLEKVILPNTLRKIGTPSTDYGTGAFFFNTNLREIILPESVEYIGPYTFGYCSNLSKVVLSDRITYIPKGAFTSCRSLADIKLPKDLTQIGEEAFADCNLKEVHIPLGTKRIKREAFKNNKRIIAVYIPPTVIEIGSPDNSPLNRVWGDCTFGDKFSRGNLTIYCTAGSAAMEYARKNNIKCAKAQF